MRALLSVAICLSAAVAFAQQARDEPQVEQGFRDMYNLDFAAAHSQFEAWGKAHPKDPRTPAFQSAAELFDAFERLHVLQSEFLTNDDNFLFPKQLAIDPALRERMMDDFAKAKQMADAALLHAPDDPHALMTLVLRSGIYADYLALIGKQQTAALAEIKQGTEWGNRLLRAHPDQYDAYLASGVENYLLSQKFGPVRWMLRLGGAQTDRQKGLNDLRIVAEKGRYLQPYAQVTLAVAALRAGDKHQARDLLAKLAARFPRNPLYREELAKIRS